MTSRTDAILMRSFLGIGPPLPRYPGGEGSREVRSLVHLDDDGVTRRTSHHRSMTRASLTASFRPAEVEVVEPGVGPARARQSPRLPLVHQRGGACPVV